MPKIAAATVGENRDLRLQAIMEAATSIATSQGLSAVTVGAVAEAAGLARSSVYAYFASAADLIADVLVDELDVMCELLQSRLHGIEDPQAIIETWMNTSLEYIIDGRHALVRSASSIELPPTRQHQIGQLHRQMVSPLVQALESAGSTNARRQAYFISAVIDVCVKRIENGGNPESEIAAAQSFALRGAGFNL